MRLTIITLVLVSLPLFAFAQAELGDVNTHSYDIRPKGGYIAGNTSFTIEQTEDPQKCVLSVPMKGRPDTVAVKFEAIIWGHLLLILGTNTMILWNDEDHGMIMSPRTGRVAVRRDGPPNDLLWPGRGTLDSQPGPGVASNAQALSSAVWGVAF
jgi:hypothetical protein